MAEKNGHWPCLQNGTKFGVILLLVFMVRRLDTFTLDPEMLRMIRSIIKSPVIFLLIMLLFFGQGVYAAEHKIEKGETALQIAIDHDLTMDQLQQLNPGTDLEMMRVGDVLILPGEGESFETFLDKHYAELVRINELKCSTAADRSAVCLFYVENISDLPLFDVRLKAEVQAGNGVRGSAESDIPLMQVLPGERIPVCIDIPGRFEDAGKASVTVVNLTQSELLQSSFRVDPVLYSTEERKSPDGIADTVTIIFSREGAASLSGKKINVLAAALDGHGQLAGVRSLYSDHYPRLDITVYSAGPAIASVVLYMEAY